MQLTVYVYNSARVAFGELAKAEEQAARIFEKVRIKVTWAVGQMVWEIKDQTGQQWNPADIQVRIYTRPMVTKLARNDCLGYSLPPDTMQAVILYDNIQKAAQLQSTSPAVLLGLAIAHEIGHILLQGHSRTGIMQAHLFPKNLRDAEQGALVFTREQGASMRSEVRRRAEIQVAGKR